MGSRKQRKGIAARRGLFVAARCAAGLAVALTTAGTTAVVASPASGTPVAGAYIVQSSSEAQAARAVTEAGGRVTAGLPLVGGVNARLDAAAVATLSQDHSLSLTPDVAMKPLGSSYGGSDLPAQLTRMDPGPLWSPQAGAGVGVALIDTGVANVTGLNEAHVVRSPDFSGSNDIYDGYGHGTFMAGLIAGNGAGGGAGAVPGMAPGATLVSVKVADSNGTTTLADVIQGIGWVLDNQSTYNIRVMSLSFGADISGPPATNPLDQAVDAAWNAGITVVAAAGNAGAGQVTSPGDDPSVITVGAETTTGAVSSPSWSAYSDQKPDVLSPGVSVVSLRDPGSIVDTENPSARVGDNYFVGSGTSMSTALVAGAAAALIAAHPDSTPQQVKAALVSTDGPALSGPAGAVDLVAADTAKAWNMPHPPAHQPAAGGAAPGSGGPSAGAWDTVRWDSVRWDSVRWDTVRWDSVRWDSVRWDSVRWDAQSWSSQAWG